MFCCHQRFLQARSTQTSHVLAQRGLLRREEGYRPIGIDRQTDRQIDPRPLQNKKLTVWFFSPSASRKMLVTLLHKTYRCGKE